MPGPCLPIAPWLLCLGVVKDAAGGGGRGVVEDEGKIDFGVGACVN